MQSNYRKQRNVDITILVMEGKTLQSTATLYRITPERVRQIVWKVIRNAAPGFAASGGRPGKLSSIRDQSDLLVPVVRDWAREGLVYTKGVYDGGWQHKI